MEQQSEGKTVEQASPRQADVGARAAPRHSAPAKQKQKLARKSPKPAKGGKGGKPPQPEPKVTFRVYALPAEQPPTQETLNRAKPLEIREGQEPDWLRELPLPEGTVIPRRKKGKGWFGSIVFYLVLVLLVLGVFLLKSGSNGAPVSFAGFSMMRVLTSSMESEIPKGSLIITKTVDANTLEIGDDITYLSNPTTTITHRIVGVTENYADTGERAFTTQGVMNQSPDSQPVPAANVVGKVIFHNYTMGVILEFIQAHWLILLVLLALLLGFFTALRSALRKDKFTSQRVGNRHSKKRQ